MSKQDPQVVARYQFRPDRAAEFVEGGRTFLEMRYLDAEEIIKDCKAFGDAILDCTAYVNGRIISLSEQPKDSD